MIEYQKYITIHPDQRSGQPCIGECAFRFTMY